MNTLNMSKVDFIARYGAGSDLEQLDTFLMQWYSASEGLKPLLSEVLTGINNKVIERVCSFANNVPGRF